MQSDVFFSGIKMSNFPFACFDKPKMRRAASGTAPDTKKKKKACFEEDYRGA